MRYLKKTLFPRQNKVPLNTKMKMTSSGFVKQNQTFENNLLIALYISGVKEDIPVDITAGPVETSTRGSLTPIGNTLRQLGCVFSGNFAIG